MSRRRQGFDSFGEVIEDYSHIPEYDEQPDFGLLFDIDGVLGRGNTVLSNAVEAFKMITDPETNELRVPVAFCTNACIDTKARAERLSEWFKIDVDPDQVIHAPSPLSVLKQYHHKRALFIGQDNILQRAHELGFMNAITIDDVKAAYPFLDMVDHSARRRISKTSSAKRDLDTIEMIVMLGEPIRWESHLQLLMDILMTNGRPAQDINPEIETHLPIVACNLDLVYMDQHSKPRFGHGPFLACLEALYEKFTNRKLEYTLVLGKPSEITYRFAEHILSEMANKMGLIRKIERIYFFGDNPDVDILGANLYGAFIRRMRHRSGDFDEEDSRLSVAKSRLIPSGVFLPQTATGIDGILVKTGVYKPDQTQTANYSHRDFQGAVDFKMPTYLVENCLEGLKLVLEKHKFPVKEPIEPPFDDAV